MDKQLLCTFTHKSYVLATLKSIVETYIVLYNKVFIYENMENRQQFLCTYNTAGLQCARSYMPSTISVHRKKESNTFFTINALNELIKENNNGVLDKDYKLNWPVYSDTAVIITDGQLQKIRIKYREVFFLEKNDRT